MLQVLHEEMIRSSKHAGRETGQRHIGVMVITGEQERTDEGAVQLSTAGKALSVHNTSLRTTVQISRTQVKVTRVGQHPLIPAHRMESQRASWPVKLAKD